MGELELALRQRIARYLAGELSLADLYAWFTGEAWNIDARSDHDTAQLYHAVDLLLSEHSRGDWTEDELKEHLYPLGRYATVETDVPVFQSTAANSGSFMAITQYAYSPPAGTTSTERLKNDSPIISPIVVPVA